MNGPLTGLRVVDLSNTLTSATISGFLADFGADVVARRTARRQPAAQRSPPSRSGARGKQSIVLDLHDADDLRVARELARGADVVIETFRPGVVERLGLGYDDLAADNPGLVFASVTAFGRTGRLRGREGLRRARDGAASAATT